MGKGWRRVMQYSDGSISMCVRMSAVVLILRLLVGEGE